MIKKCVFLAVIMLVVSISSALWVPAFASGGPEGSVSVADFGAVGDDAIDDTEAIQQALNNSSSVFIPAGLYLVNAEVSLRLKSDQTLTMADDTVLKALPTSKESYSVLKIDNISDVTVVGGSIKGERYQHLGTSGEWGMGIMIINSSKGITIENVKISDCWGDGIYLGREKVQGIKINNVVCSNNRRQGISITNAYDVVIRDTVLSGSNGTAPQSGLDIEPNTGQNVEKVLIENSRASNNAGVGFAMIGVTGEIHDITYRGCESVNNGASGMRFVNTSNVAVEGFEAIGNDIGINIIRDVSNIRFDKTEVRDSFNRGVSLIGTKQTTGIQNVIFTDSKIYNNSTKVPGQYDGVRVDNYDKTGVVEDVSFFNCEFVDNQKNPTQRYGLTIGRSQFLNNMKMDTLCYFKGNIKGGCLADESVLALVDRGGINGVVFINDNMIPLGATDIAKEPYMDFEELDGNGASMVPLGAPNISGQGNDDEIVPEIDRLPQTGSLIETLLFPLGCILILIGVVIRCRKVGF